MQQWGGNKTSPGMQSLATRILASFELEMVNALAGLKVNAFNSISAPLL